MSICAKYDCFACSISTELRGYQIQEEIRCPQCAQAMPATSVEHSYEYNDVLGCSSSYLRYRHHQDRIYTPAFANHTPIQSMMNDEEIRELIRKSISARLTEIDKTATNARITAESLRQSVVDQQSSIHKVDDRMTSVSRTAQRQYEANQAMVSKVEQRMVKAVATINDLESEVTSTREGLGSIGSESATVADRLESAERRLRVLKRTTKKIDERMSYVEKETEIVAAATPTTPAIGDVAKTVGSALGTGLALGASTQFIAEVTELAVTRALKAGYITPALGESVMFKEALKLCIPMMMLAASQYPACPKREFFGKVGELATRGQAAQHAAMATVFAMSFVTDMLALPSASGLDDRLSAAQ